MLLAFGQSANLSFPIKLHLFQTRIVAGENAAVNAYPYYAVLIDSGTISTVRGGATISK